MKMLILIDILGTLLAEEGDPRPQAREVLFKFIEMGDDISVEKPG